MHGILSGIGWGILMPMGIIMVGPLKILDDVGPIWWFYPYIASQFLAYVLGIAGLVLGLKLGLQQYQIHAYIGIALIFCAMAQPLIIHSRPYNYNFKRLVISNVCFYIVASSLIGLSIYDMVSGFSIHHHHHHNNNNDSYLRS